eukprot:1314307-Rhodomonas_salina.1
MHRQGGYAVANCMQIRLLLGRKRWNDLRPIDEHDLEQAKAIVDSFDAFVPLEHLAHPAVRSLLKKTIPEYYEGLVNNSLPLLE